MMMKRLILILGVALALPREATEVDRRAVYVAMNRWEEAHRQEDEDTPPVMLLLGSAGEMRLERLEWGAAQASLRSDTWCRPSAAWLSATPVALDRNPGDLRSRDPRALQEAVDTAGDSIRASCERIGLPRPRRVDILPAAPWAGAAKASQYPRFPSAPDRTQRVLTHARLEFDGPVRGPVLIGAGRFSGLGLFRPEAPR